MIVHSKNIQAKWVPEVQRNCPQVQLLLLGTKAELREDVEHQKKMEESGKTFVTKEEIREMMIDINAIGYHECSAVKFEGIDALGEIICDCYFNPEDLKDKSLKALQ